MLDQNNDIPQCEVCRVTITRLMVHKVSVEDHLLDIVLLVGDIITFFFTALFH